MPRRELQPALERRHRVLDASRPGLGAREGHVERRRRGAEAQRDPERGDGLGEATQLEERAAQVEGDREGPPRLHPALPRAAALGERLENPGGAGVVSRLEERDRPGGLAVEGLVLDDRVLRVDTRGGPGEEGPADVAERGQAFRRARVDRAHRGGRPRLVEAPQPLLHRGRHLAALVEAVLRLPGVLAQVVELGARGLDVLPAQAAQGTQRGPAEVELAEEALRVGLVLGESPGREQGRGPARPARGRRREPEQVEDRRQEVHAPELSAHPPTRRQPARPGEDERHAQGGVVDEELVFVLAVVPEALAVVGRDDDEGVQGLARLLQPLEKPSDLRVGVGHLAVVGYRPEALPPGGRGVVRRVGVEDVDPGEERPVAGGSQPRQRRVHDRGRAAGAALQAQSPSGRAAEGVVEDVEAPIEPRVAGYRVGPDEPARRVAGLSEQCGQGRVGRVEGRREVVADPVLVGLPSREDRDVGRACLGYLDDGVLDEDALRGEAVHVRRLGRPVPVGPDAVRPQRVDGHEEEIRLWRGGAGRSAARCAEGQPDAGRGRDDDKGHGESASAHSTIMPTGEGARETAPGAKAPGAGHVRGGDSF